MNLDRASKWFSIGLACFALVTSGAGASALVGRTQERLANLEQKTRDYGTDHDTLTRLDANMKWIVQALGGEPK